MTDQHTNNNHSFSSFSYQNSISKDGQIIASLKDRIEEKNMSVAFYKKLLDMAPNDYDYNHLSPIVEDEVIHYELLSQLHLSLTKSKLKTTEATIAFRTYRDGLQKAYENELKSYKLYQSLYFQVFDANIRDIIFRAMTDDMEHANRFMFLYIRNNL